MNRKTLTAVAAFALLGLIAFFALRQPEKGEAARDRQRPLAKLNAGELDTLLVTRGATTTTTIKKEGAKYKVTAPVAYAADDPGAKAAFDTLEKLELADLVTENKTKHAEFEVDDARGVHVVAKSQKDGTPGGGKVLADIVVGKTIGNGTMVRLAGKDQVWQAPGGLRATFDKPPADWRDKTITTIAAADAELLTVKAKDGGVAIVKKSGAKAPGGGDDKWDLVTSVPKIDKVDNSIPVGIVSALSSFKTNDFADGAAPAVTGLDAPTLTVTVALKGGKNVTVLVGNKKGDDDFYVKTADGPQVFLVKKANLEHINKRPIEFKDKLLCDIGEADLADVTVTHGADSFSLTHTGTMWKATKPAKLEIDPTKAPPLAGGFKEWKATGFAEDGAPAVTGLAKPRATVVAKSKKGDTCSFKIGDETKDKVNVYLQSAKTSDVYLAPKWSVDRLLVKLDDLKKK